MSFCKAGDFVFLAAQKYKLSDQALAALVCERVRKVFLESFSEFALLWVPQKFCDGVLYVEAQNSSASSELFLRTHELLEILGSQDLPEKVVDVRIVRKIVVSEEITVNCAERFKSKRLEPAFVIK